MEAMTSVDLADQTWLGTPMQVIEQHQVKSRANLPLLVFKSCIKKDNVSY